MSKLEKLQTFIILLAVGTGLLLGQIEVVRIYAEYLIVPVLAAMLYGLFLSVPLKIKQMLLKTSVLRWEALLSIPFGPPVLTWLLGYLLL